MRHPLAEVMVLVPGTCDNLSMKHNGLGWSVHCFLQFSPLQPDSPNWYLVLLVKTSDEIL